MAFDIKRFSRVSLADNTGRLVLQDSSVVNAPAVFTYASASDAIATIEAANYFNDEGAIYDLQVDDVIMVIASDADAFLQVATVDLTTSPKTITTVTFTESAPVDTADIVDGAVTNAKVNAAAAIDFSKLAALPSGDIIVGSSLTVPTARAVIGDITLSNTGVTAIGANKVLSSMISPLVEKYVAVPMTAAQFKAIYSAPFVMIAAQGANTLIVLKRAVIAMTYVSADYAAGGVVGFQYDSTVHGGGVAASNTEQAADFFAAASTSFAFNGEAGNTVAIAPFTTTVNKAIYLSCLTADFTTGDSTFVVHLWYSVIPTV